MDRLISGIETTILNDHSTIDLLEDGTTLFPAEVQIVGITG
jgi:hypothetical protein